jgi:hypothetical protein
MVTVAFAVPASVGGSYVDVVGEFLCWVPMLMDKRSDGSFVATIQLDAGHCWRYRLLVDGERWLDDWEGANHVAAEDGGRLFLLRT